MKLQLQDTTARTRAQRMNQITVGAFFNMPEKLATENKLSDTSRNILNIDESGIQVKT